MASGPSLYYPPIEITTSQISDFNSAVSAIVSAYVINNAYPTVDLASSSTIPNGNAYYFVTAAGDTTQILPDATIGNGIYLNISNIGSGNATIQGPSGQTINGGTNFILPPANNQQESSITLVSRAGNWRII